MADISVVRARTILARSFTDDPLMVWFFPDDDSRPHAVAALFGLLAEHYLADGRVDVLAQPDPVGVAMWRWPTPDAPAESAPEELPSVGGLMTALMGVERAMEIGGAMQVLEQRRTPGPHAYLHLLAVDPSAWRRGGGGELLERGLAAARAEGLEACLETMNPANVPFYEAHGMSVRHEERLAPDGPTTWWMATG
ncbi:GNAT family N-acetyltransferase [Candidatus Blastococcus massiliensis]|uniref:GNAT family N-acetyltransferase n=1 Tax=Candidatus Blastococcus massiliensis TaxID=1470358 RepID=UPI0012DE8B58|nr:GNAT family N-acetyltransferase [Candidatus Blastococcus massiliensis]